MVIRQWAAPVVLPALERGDLTELEAAELLNADLLEVRTLLRARARVSAHYWLNTATGRRFSFLAPRAEDIDIVDIAIALANQARYAGHTRRHYSVAEHCVILSLAAPEQHAAWALMHDAAEAYITDIPWPLKAAGLVQGLAAVEQQIMRVICERFGMDPIEPREVKELDLEILDLEADALLVRHADWPKGTPREPRARLREVWERWRRGEEFLGLGGVYHLPALIPPGLGDMRPVHTFMRQAFLLGLATVGDHARLRVVLDGAS